MTPARAPEEIRALMDLDGLGVVMLLLSVGVIAFLYSSVGHGGATGYLAVMSLLGVSAAFARAGALWINVFVAFVAFWRFRGAGYFEGRIFSLLACASVPCAWWGSHLQLEGAGYDLVLGVALLAAGWLLGWGHRPVEAVSVVPVRLWPTLALGAGLGFVAGLTGIGGGVYLTPALIFLRWVQPKTAGGISALFIVVNSIAGLVGLWEKAWIKDPVAGAAPVVGVLAAWMGTSLSVRRWNTATFRRVLALVLWIAAGKSLVRILI